MREQVTMQNSKPVKRLRGWQKGPHVQKAKGFKCCPVTLFLHEVHYRECQVEGHHFCHLLPVAVDVSMLRSFSKLCLLASIEELNKPPPSLGILHDFVPNIGSFLFFVVKGHTKQKSYKLNDFLSAQIFFHI